ncbi:hypothetical protein DCM91_00895 [Chitinophaga costaii]|nr:hypothetical protein DCM91_00895 [Chitinophaga costaii]
MVALLISISPVLAQSTDSTRTGEVKGTVRDSLRNYSLQLATIAVYTVNDTALLSYQLTNGFGAFYFEQLPLNVPLKVIVTYVGYQQFIKYFKIPTENHRVDLQLLYLKNTPVNLKDVVVTAVPPVQMNGDTLEFNADAFKLDPNAVAEDLLRKLPGITIWGDGVITIGGKKVNNVLVNGKPFLGGDTKVATQNIPKNVIDKIQVYQQRTDIGSPMDSITQLNIKLKKGKDFGYLGTLSAGYGTGGHYDAAANFNWFNSRTQFGIMGVSNNVNKIAPSSNTLLRNSTYKGVSDGGLEYQSDLSLEGITTSHAGGLFFQHDFIPDPGASKNNRITADFTSIYKKNNTSRSTETLVTLGRDSIQRQQLRSNQFLHSNTQQFNGKYEKKDYQTSYFINPAISAQQDHRQYREESDVYGFNKELQSSNNITTDNNQKARSATIAAGFTKSPLKYGLLPGDIRVNNTFSINDSVEENANKTIFTSYADSALNAHYDRNYHEKRNSLHNDLFVSWGDFSKWLFDAHGFMNKFSVKLQNRLILNTEDVNNMVTDSGGHFINQYLTVKSNAAIINEMPGINLGKSFDWILSDRYSKNLSFGFLAQAQFYTLKNSSNHAFQELDRQYKKLIPTIGINYTNAQWGKYLDQISLNMNFTSDYPGINQLVPLTDSSNQYILRVGNTKLQPTDKKELAFNWNHSSFNRRNVLNYSFSTKAGIIKNSFADSSFTDQLGRSTYYTVNADGYKYLNLEGAISKAFDINKNEITLSFDPKLNLSHTPSYINGRKNWSDNLNATSSLHATYTHNELQIVIAEEFSYYQSSQSWSANNLFRNYLNVVKLGATLNLFESLNISSNIDYNYTTATSSNATHFFVWNATAAYRFLKQKNVEVKLTAMDMLHQNMGIINYGSSNLLTHGSESALKQYFLFTLSYYPRKFGK